MYKIPLSEQKLMAWWQEMPKIWQLFLYNHGTKYAFQAEDLDMFDDILAGVKLADVKKIAAIKSLPVVFTPGTLILQDLDLSPLTQLPQLGELTLINTQLRDLVPIAQMKMLHTLTLSGPNEWVWNSAPPYYPFEFNRGNLSPLEGHNNLTNFYLYGNAGFLDIDLELLSRLLMLRSLALADTALTQITNISPLKNAARLEYLDLGHTSITTLSDIWGLKLRTLVVPKGFSGSELKEYRREHKKCFVRISAS